MPPIIDENKCIKCSKCVEICAQDVFFGFLKKNVPDVTYPDFCIHCNCCVRECSVEGAIRLRIPLPLMLLFK